MVPPTLPASLPLPHPIPLPPTTPVAQRRCPPTPLTRRMRGESRLGRLGCALSRAGADEQGAGAATVAATRRRSHSTGAAQALAPQVPSPAHRTPVIAAEQERRQPPSAAFSSRNAAWHPGRLPPGRAIVHHSIEGISLQARR